MQSRTRHFLVSAVIILASLIVALVVFSFRPGEELAIGNLVLRAQRGVSYPLRAPDDASRSPARLAPADDGVAAPRARNAVIFIGDGMGIGHVSAASDLLDRTGGTLVMMSSPFVSLVRTWASNTLVTDSAASGTSLATGFKTDKRMVGMLPDGSIPRNLLEVARERGMATGVLTTSGLVDATPASFTTHVAHRERYDEILEQMLDSGTTVLVGGDWLKMKKARRNERYCELVSGVDELGGARGYNVIRDPDAVASASLPILALFSSRSDYAEQHGPRLAVSARRIVELLLEQDEGFVLVIESEVTDELAHANDIEAVMNGMRELDEAVAAVLGLVGESGDTLVLVTADHDTGALSLVDGYYEDEAATVRWSTSYHTSHWVPLFAFGPGAELFAGVLDNTEIAKLTARVLGLDPFPMLVDVGEG
jgi:alkaline phosphatase